MIAPGHILVQSTEERDAILANPRFQPYEYNPFSGRPPECIGELNARLVYLPRELGVRIKKGPPLFPRITEEPCQSK